MGRKRDTSSSLSGFFAMRDMYATPKDAGVMPVVKHLQMSVCKVLAQKGTFLYTMYGNPFGPGAEPFDRCFNMSKNSCQDGGPDLNVCVGVVGRDICLGGVYLVSRNSSEYVVLK